MPIGLGTKPLAVQLVGKQQLVAAQGRHRDRRVQRLQHRGETLVRGRQLLAHPIGLGDVGHRSHPAGLRSHGIDQRRHIQAGIKHAAVAAFDAHLKAAGAELAGQFFFQLGRQQLAVGFGPVREGRGASHQVGLAPAGHLAKGGVDIGDATLQVHRAHAGEHGVFHGPAEIGFRHQGLLGLQPPAGMAPIGNQHPGRHHAECSDQPEQATADHAQRGTIGLAAYHQAAAHGRHRHGIGVGARRPGQSVAGRLAGWNHRAGQ